MVRAAIVLTIVPLLFASDPKGKVSDYPVQFKAGDLEFGLEYMVRSIAHEGQTITLDDYLVVEVAIFPPPGRELMVSTQSFMLRVNGKKDLLHSQTPSMVAASLKYPDWERRRELNVGASAGDAGIILGRPRPVERFPGDNRPSSQRIPGPVPRVPTDPREAPEKKEIDPADFIERSSLPEGPRKTPVAGYLFFAHRGKLSSIRTVELLYRLPSGDLVATRLR